MRYILIISLLFFIHSCTIENNKNNKDLTINFTIDTLKINTQENALSLTDAPYIIEEDSKEFYLNYNEAFNVLLFFDLETKKFERKVQFEKSGPSQLHSCEEYVIYGDTIIVNDILAIKFFDKNGELIKALKIEDLCIELKDKYKLSKSGINIGNLFEMDLNKKTNSIVLRTFKNGFAYEDHYYENPVFCEFNLKTVSGISIPVAYPEELYSSLYYDDLAAPNIISLNDQIIYNFHFKASIFIYNKESRKTKELEFHSQHIPDLIKGVKRSSVNGITNLFFGPKYHNIKYDPYKKKFYLLYSDGAKEEENQYLIIFDNTFQKLGEIKIPTGYSSKFVVSKKGLLFRNINDMCYYWFNLYAINLSYNKK